MCKACYTRWWSICRPIRHFSSAFILSYSLPHETISILHVFMKYSNVRAVLQHQSLSVLDMCVYKCVSGKEGHVLHSNCCQGKADKESPDHRELVKERSYLGKPHSPQLCTTGVQRNRYESFHGQTPAYGYASGCRGHIHWDTCHIHISRCVIVHQKVMIVTHNLFLICMFVGMHFPPMELKRLIERGVAGWE